MQNILEFFNEKKLNFITFLKEVSQETNNLNNISEKMNSDLLSLFFLMSLKEENKQKNIDDFLIKMKIDDKYRVNIQKYFDCFLDIKNIYINEKKTKYL